MSCVGCHQAFSLPPHGMCGQACIFTCVLVMSKSAYVCAHVHTCMSKVYCCSQTEGCALSTIVIFNTIISARNSCPSPDKINKTVQFQDKNSGKILPVNFQNVRTIFKCCCCEHWLICSGVHFDARIYVCVLVHSTSLSFGGAATLSRLCGSCRTAVVLLSRCMGLLRHFEGERSVWAAIRV